MDELLGKLAQVEAALGRGASQESLLAWQTLLLHSLDGLSVVESADVCTQAWRVLISFYVRQSTSPSDRKSILHCIRSVLPQGRDALQCYHARLVPGGLSDLHRRLESCLSVSPATPNQESALIMPSKKLKLDTDRSRALHWLLAGSLAPLLWKLPAYQALLLSQTLSPASPPPKNEQNAQLYALDCLAKLDQESAVKAFPTVIRLIQETPVGDSAELSIKLLRHMHRDQALLSMTLKTCETLLLQRTLDTDQQALIRVMTLLSAASPFVIGEQIAVLLKILTSPTASTRIQGTVLDHTYWLAERAMHRVPVTVFWALAKHMVSHTNPLIQDKCLRIIALSALNPAYIDSALAYLYASTENVTTTTVPLDAIVEALFSISLGGRSSGLQAAQTLSVVLSHPLLSFFADSKCTILALHCQDLIKAIQERSAQSLLPAHSSRAVRRLCWALFELSPLLLKHNTLGDKLRDSVIALMKDGKLTQVLLQSILKSPRGSLFFKAHMDAFFVLSKGWDNVQWRVYLYRHALQCLPYVMGDANYEARSKTLMDLLLDLRPKTHLWHIYQLALEASHAGSWDTAATLYQTLTVELSSADLVSEPCMKWIESLSLFAEEEATLQAALSAPDSDPSVFRTDLRGLLSSLLEHPLSDEFSPRNTFQKTLLHLRKDTLQACLWLLDLHLSDADPKDLASMARSILLKLRGTGQGFTKLSRTFLDIDVSSLEAIRDWGDLIEGVVSSLIGETNVPTGQVNDDSVMDVDDSVDNTDLLDISLLLAEVQSLLSHTFVIPKYFFVGKTKAVIRLTIEPPLRQNMVVPRGERLVIRIQGKLELPPQFPRVIRRASFDLEKNGTPIGTYMCKLTCPTNVFTAELPLLFDQDLSEAQSLVATCGLLDENGQRWDTGPRIEFPVTVAGVQ